MKFYVVMGHDGPPIGCEYSKAKAIKTAKADGNEGTRVDEIVLNCNPREAVRRLLASEGGYALSVTSVFEITQP